MKRKEEDRIQLYANRKVLQCDEAAFDFIRANRRVWVKSALVLFLPICVALSLVAIPTTQTQINNAQNYIWERFFEMESWHFDFFLIVTCVGIWLAYVHVYTLLLAEFQREEGVKTAQLSSLIPYFLRSASRSWWLFAVPIALAFIMNIGVLFALLLPIILVPLSLLPSIFILEHESMPTAISKSFRLGFSSWFYLAFNIILTMMLALCMVWLLQVPSLVMDIFMDILPKNADYALGHLPFYIFWMIFSTFSCFGFCVVVSMLVLGCAFQYGSVSERVDDTSILHEIENFENL